MNKSKTALGAMRFTLLELMVVVAIIMMLLSLLLPALGKARESAQVISCMGNLKQLGVGEFQYVGDSGDFFPTAWDMGGTDKMWFDILYACDLAPKPQNPVVGIHRCPSETRGTPVGTRSYYGQNRFAYVWAKWLRQSKLQAPSETTLLYDTQTTPNYDNYAAPGDLLSTRNINSNRHRGGAMKNYILCDGHGETAQRNLVASGLFIWTLMDWTLGNPTGNYLATPLRTL